MPVKEGKNLSIGEKIRRLRLSKMMTQAELAGMGIDPFIRSIVSGVQLRPRPPDTYTALLRELSAIGNNVNQIAYWANAQQSASEADIQEAAALVRRAWRLVKETL